MTKLIDLKDFNKKLKEPITLEYLQNFCYQNNIFIRSYSRAEVNDFVTKSRSLELVIQDLMKIYNKHIVISNDQDLIIINSKIKNLIKLLNLKQFL
jgi:hypothetical protein